VGSLFHDYPPEPSEKGVDVHCPPFLCSTINLDRDSRRSASRPRASIDTTRSWTRRCATLPWTSPRDAGKFLGEEASQW